MFTCSKTYRDIPFAHRQHRHDGHCSFLHGHNWGIEIEFGCEKLDERGFVVDFGGLGFLKTWIADHLDHACLFAKEDPIREQLLKDYPKLFRPPPKASPSSSSRLLIRWFARKLAAALGFDRSSCTKTPRTRRAISRRPDHG
jgi:6-pyruvoyl-tetrahydropterin synthase